MAKEPKLKELRDKIDSIDRELLKFLGKRMEISKEIGKAKKTRGVSSYQPEREEEIFSKMTASNKKSALSNIALRRIYTEIMSASRALQESISVGFLGPEGTFSYIATIRHFGHSINLIPQRDISEVFIGVEKGAFDFGVVPVENSMEGTVNATLDMFRHTTVKVNAEILLKVVHNLVSLTGQREDMRTIYSHPQPAAQCRMYLNTHFPNVKLVETQSSAVAAEKAASNKKIAAIASEYAAKEYSLKMIDRNIEDSANNITKFFVIGQHLNKKSSHSKTSILFSLKDRPGVLYDALRPFSKNGVNLTKIESRPTREKAWDYVFFIDMDGHIEDDPIQEAVEELNSKARFVKVLGSYPACKEIL
ncbi:MAG: prephenate dehydratase [Deltaproteobacteria bacterium]|nr:prephenate dehydratase [Deltaproteobacteria bacterium]